MHDAWMAQERQKRVSDGPGPVVERVPARRVLHRGVTITPSRRRGCA